jgi:hypothetical protein
MLVENQKIEIKWTKQNKKKYASKGYEFTNYGDSFLVDANDLNKSDKTKVKAVCDYCGSIYDVVFKSYYDNISNGEKNACRNCLGTKAAETTLLSRQDKIYQMVQDKLSQKNCTLITKKEDIQKTDGVVEYLCGVHGVTQSIISHILYHDCGCRECGKASGSIQRNQNSLLDRQEHLYQRITKRCSETGYNLSTKKEDITCNTDYIEYVCKTHGIHKMQIYNFLNGKGCPGCAIDNAAERYKLPTNEVISRVNNLGGVVLNAEDYKNTHEKNLKILCFECGMPFITSLGCFEEHGGQVCPSCSGSKSVGEKKIECYLINNKINFIPQKWFSDCKDKKPLPFDFYLPDLNTLIEFDGRQHFEETNHFTYPLEMVQKHDKIKNDYCKGNSIYLIRIPYWDVNKIEQILDKELILHEDIV